MIQPSAIDPFLFEVLRHRLATLTVEAATALQRVSGSPLATEAFDMNTSIMSAAGEVVFVGPYLLTGPIGQGLIVGSILADDALAGTLEPGDRFICNDPYAGSAHQNCVSVVGPLFADNELVAWAGATLHVVDVGGSTAGQVGIGAASIHDEAPVIPPTRIVRGGKVIEEIERAYLARSRTPEINALDLRGKIAALNAIDAGVANLVRDHGAATVVDILDMTLDRATAHFQRRLEELPDGVAHHLAFVDQTTNGLVEYRAVDLRLEKSGRRLRLDFGGSADQAPAVVNCTRSGLRSGVVIGLLTTLVWDAPWCPAAVERSVEIVSRPGSVVDATWPAGCSMATMASGFAATTVTALSIGELLGRDDALRSHAMAAWAGAVGSVDVFGEGADGQSFGTVLLDTMAAGTGAGPLADGIDCGGFLRSIACVVANVEQTEAQFPILYLYRRQEPDSGGPGRQRGGAGLGYAVMAHGVERIATVSPHFSGSSEPESSGLAGGFPGAMNAASLVSDSGAVAQRSRGLAVAAPDELAGRREPLPGVARVSLGPDDVLVIATTGGGGFGDPIERDPDAVGRDIRSGVVSLSGAAAQYGVVARPDGSVDKAATREARAAIRASRTGRNARTPRQPTEGDGAAIDGTDVLDDPTGRIIRCRRCGETWPAHDERGWAGSRSALTPIRAGVVVHGEAGRGDRFRLEETYCPACARLLSVRRVDIGEGAHA